MNVGHRIDNMIKRITDKNYPLDEVQSGGIVVSRNTPESNYIHVIINIEKEGVGGIGDVE